VKYLPNPVLFIRRQIGIGEKPLLVEKEATVQQTSTTARGVIASRARNLEKAIMAC
jgi:hypothetical protein